MTTCPRVVMVLLACLLSGEAAWQRRQRGAAASTRRHATIDERLALNVAHARAAGREGLWREALLFETSSCARGGVVQSRAACNGCVLSLDCRARLFLVQSHGRQPRQARPRMPASVASSTKQAACSWAEAQRGATPCGPDARPHTAARTLPCAAALPRSSALSAAHSAGLPRYFAARSDSVVSTGLARACEGCTVKPATSVACAHAKYAPACGARRPGGARCGPRARRRPPARLCRPARQPALRAATR